MTDFRFTGFYFQQTLIKNFISKYKNPAMLS